MSRPFHRDVKVRTRIKLSRVSPVWGMTIGTKASYFHIRQKKAFIEHSKWTAHPRPN